MKTYIYKITKQQRDNNGNPQSLVTVYRLKRGVPVFLGENASIDYRSNEQSACDIIYTAENNESWHKKHTENPVWKARTKSIWEKPPIIRLFQV